MPDDDLFCDVCGAAGNDQTIYAATVMADKPDDKQAFIAFVQKRPTSVPVAMRTWFLTRCPGHSDEEILNAGFMPPAWIDNHGNLREALRTARGTIKPGSPEWNIARLLSE